MIETITHFIWMLVSLMWLAVSFFAFMAAGRLFIALNEWLTFDQAVSEDNQSFDLEGAIKH